MKFLAPIFYARTTESFDMAYRWHEHVIGFFKKRGLRTSEGALYASELEECLRWGYLLPKLTPEPLIHSTIIGVGDSALWLYRANNTKTTCSEELANTCQTSQIAMYPLSGGGIVDIVAELKVRLQHHRATSVGYRPAYGFAVWAGTDLLDAGHTQPLNDGPGSVLRGLRALGPISQQFDNFVLIVAGDAQLWGLN